MMIDILLCPTAPPTACADIVEIPCSAASCGSGALTIRSALTWPKAKVIGVDYWGAVYNYIKALCEKNAAREGVASRCVFQHIFICNYLRLSFNYIDKLSHNHYSLILWTKKAKCLSVKWEKMWHWGQTKTWKSSYITNASYHCVQTAQPQFELALRRICDIWGFSGFLCIEHSMFATSQARCCEY